MAILMCIPPTTSIPVPLPFFSFTGAKHSFAGDSHFYGKNGVQFYTQLKTITAAWKSASDGPSMAGVGASPIS